MPVSHRTKRTVARKFWQYMKTNKQLLETRTELRQLYYTFRATLEDPAEGKVPFCDVMYLFRGKVMRVIEWRPVGERENIIYRPGPKVAVDHSFLLRREARSSVDDAPRFMDDLAELKKKIVSTSRQHLASDKGNICIQPENNEEGIVCMVANANILQLTVSNQSIEKVMLRCISLGSASDFSVDDRIHKIVSGGKTVKLPGYGTIDFTVKLSSSNPGIYCIPIAFMFKRDNEETFHIVKYVRAEVIDDVVRDLQPLSPYCCPKPVARVSDPEVEIIPGEPPPIQNICYVRPLQKYPIPGELRHLMNSGQLQAVMETEFKEDVTERDHCSRFSKLLHVEELQMQVDIQKYSMKNATLVKKDGYLSLVVPGLAENRPSLVRGDRLFVRKLSADGTTAEKKEYEGFVHQIGLNEVYLKFSSNFHSNFIRNSSYRVRFTFSRTSLKLMHRAVEMASRFLRLIPADGGPLDVSARDSLDVGSIRYFDQKVGSNKEQMQAVENIVAGTSRPYPYLVFGPPGTGKTVTIVEAIKQVLKNDPSSTVLACTPSNSAADLILERVAQHCVVPKTQMVRLNAFGRLESTVSPKVKEFCLMSRDGYFYFPPKEDIKNNYRLVVTTLISAGRFFSLGIEEGHFTHIFIDEAGHGMEPESLVAVAGLLGTDATNAGQLVLAGDPKQLGPVLRSPVAIKLGLGVSFLERLMSAQFPCYNRRPQDNQYDARVVTKLLNNYRSHPSIIQLPNEMFYENELRACADELLRSSLCHWDGLKKKGFPVIFESVCGKDEREENSPSFFNPQEVSVVLKYVSHLKDSRGIPLKTEEIGIISPYHKQVQKIRQSLQKKAYNIRDIKVGSVEEFQGQERKVIIISTVRSSEKFLQLDATYKLGFLKNPKRFNVAITRAKALLIVVGNPHVLCRDDHWRRFIQYCLDNGSFGNGGPGSSSGGSSFQMPQAADENLAAQLNKLSLNEETIENEDHLTRAHYEDPAWRPEEH